MSKYSKDDEQIDLSAFDDEERNSPELKRIKNVKKEGDNDGRGGKKRASGGKVLADIGSKLSSIGVTKIVLALCALVLVIAVGVIGAVAIASVAKKSADKQFLSKPQYSTSDFAEDYKSDISKYAISLNTTNDAYHVLVNKNNRVDENYGVGIVREEIDAKLNASAPGYELQVDAKNAAEALLTELRANGYRDIYVTSAYRSYSRQQKLYNDYIAAEIAKGHSEEEARKQAETYSAPPGASEHQTGLCIDFYIYGRMSDLVNYGSETATGDDIGFAESEEYAWLCNNAHKFGFILRYPEGKEDTTGYAFESWHYRFVGVDLAAKLHEKGLTLEEYHEIMK